MRKPIALFALIICCFTLVDFTVNARGSELTLFEKTYIRETQKPKVVTDNFTVADLSGTFALVVKNGKDGNNRVSSAVIQINGKQILGPSDFNEQVDLVTRDFTLELSNEITVELSSKPGSFIVVNIIAEGQNTPPVANAGPDQTVPLGSTVTLDASKSSDADGDLLAYKWSFDAQPPDSTATLNDPSARRGCRVTTLMVMTTPCHRWPYPPSGRMEHKLPVLWVPLLIMERGMQELPGTVNS